MNDTDRYLKVVSLLLQYPDEAYFKALPEIKSFVSGMNSGPRKSSIEEFIANLEAEGVFHAQERYTALFDMSPSTTLNVTYHLWGDGEKRARLLAALQQEYADAGLEKESPELPDYLPMILEFMASVPSAKWSDAIQKSLESVKTLADRLRPAALHYSGLLGPLAEMIADQGKKQTAARAT